MNKQELENRLISFSVSIISLTKELDSSFESQHLGKQIVRSGTAVSLLYGEVQGAISKKDFIHKISLVIRELKETHINLRVISQSNLSKNKPYLDEILGENGQLIAIFMKTLLTAKSNE